MSACVPKITSVWPDASLARASSFIRGVREPTRRSARIHHFMSHASWPEKCCLASISVGAMIATWIHLSSSFWGTKNPCSEFFRFWIFPSSRWRAIDIFLVTRIACAVARSATTVFPVPTSPWSIRAIACGCSISLSIWKRTIFCLSVREKGRDSMSSFMSSVSIVIAGASHWDSFWRLYFFSSPRFWKWKSSSYPISLFARSKSSRECGKWIAWIFSFLERIHFFWRIADGIVSGISEIKFRRRTIFSRIQEPGI